MQEEFKLEGLRIHELNKMIEKEIDESEKTGKHPDFDYINKCVVELKQIWGSIKC